MATSPEFDTLVTAVNENLTVDDSVITFLDGLAPMIAAAAGDKAAGLALAAMVTAKSAAVSAAITANTPVPPTP